MAKSSMQKLKLLYLYTMLMEKTDENHPMTVKDMISELAKYGINAERKSIYDDLELLSDVYGMDIVQVKSKTFGYYVGSRQFELAELKLLVDSVQSAKFMTAKKSLSLISKIEQLAGHYDAQLLRRQVYVTNRVKAANENIYYNVDRIHDAIARNRRITFKYFEWTMDKTKKYRKDGQLYTETPISLTWDDENYYLITYKQKYNSFTHYRVDKMECISITDDERIMPEKEFDPAEYSKKVFLMFGGQEENVTVEFDASLAGVVIDRFGMDVSMHRTDDNRFSANLRVAVSNQFLAWIMNFGTKAKIIAPKSVADKFVQLLEETKGNYA
ncbi:MAG: WYL domain-containing protein [Clostridia bacterium]|nr:WYL domain-containing protein [Clostridia bacterium]